MRFTEYIWNLYKNSTEGVDFIRQLDNIDIKSLSVKYNFQYSFEVGGDFKNELNIQTSHIDISSNVLDYTKNIQIFSIEEARSFFEDYVFQKGIPLNFTLNNGDNELIPYLFTENKENSEFKYFFDFFEAITICLYKSFPDYFFPFLFDRKGFSTFIKVCENFDIAIPAFPPRNNWIKKIWFYFDLCVSLNEFRRFINLSSKDFVAFIYDFGVKTLIDTKKEELPQPNKVWFLGAGEWDYKFLDNSDDFSSSTWGAGTDRIKCGDIMIMYCTLPRKSIHSIWRATSDSFINPFAYYYYVVNVGFPIKINSIGFQELLSNSVFKDNSTVKARMQGLNGKPLNQNEYLELLRLINDSGIDTSVFPNLTNYNHTNDNIQDERDVELLLIEPLLSRLGFKNNDWMRQMPIRMGRGVRYFPDYTIFFNSKRGEESAKIIIEAKYEILSDKQLEEAYLQAKSYAIRLQSDIFVIADKFKLYLFEPMKNIFDLKNRIVYTWNDLDNPDSFHSFKEKIKK